MRDDHFYALDAASGAVVWKAPAPAPQPFWNPVFQDPTKSSPAVAGGRVFVGIERDVTALDSRTGRVPWRFPTGKKVDSTPLVVGDVVYVGSDDRTFYALEAATGRQLWSYRTGGRVSSSPTAGEGLYDRDRIAMGIGFLRIPEKPAAVLRSLREEPLPLPHE